MAPLVEPIEGPELDRLITALLNATGCVHQVIEGVQADTDCVGVEIIGESAARLRSSLALLAEHHDDDELAPITDFLALTSLLVAEDGGFDDAFYEA